MYGKIAEFLKSNSDGVAKRFLLLEVDVEKCFHRKLKINEEAGRMLLSRRSMIEQLRKLHIPAAEEEDELRAVVDTELKGFVEDQIEVIVDETIFRLVDIWKVV